MQIKPDVEHELMQSLKALVLTSPIEKITIKEITDKANVIRPTFYNHFQDKYEVIERILKQEILEPIKPLLQNEMIDESLILIFMNLQKDKEFYMKLSRSTGQNSLEEIIRKCVQEILFELMEKRTDGKSGKDKWLTPIMLSQFYAQSMTFVVINWIQRGMPLTPKEIAGMYYHMMTTSMKDIMQELQDQ